MDSAYSMSQELHHRPLLQLNGCNPPPMRRGPMYSAYAELRELNLRRRRAVSISPVFHSSTTSASALSRSVADLSLSLRKENKKPPPPPLSQTSEAWAASPPPMTPSAEARRARGKSVTPPPAYSQRPEMAATPRHPMTPRAGHNRGAEERRGGGVLSLTKSFSCLDELKEFNAARSASLIDKEGKGLSKGGVLSRIDGSYRRQRAYMC